MRADMEKNGRLARMRWPCAPAVALYAAAQTALSIVLAHAAMEARDARAIARAALHILSSAALTVAGAAPRHSATLCALAAALAGVVDAGVLALAAATALVARAGVRDPLPVPERAAAAQLALAAATAAVLVSVRAGPVRTTARAHAVACMLTRTVDLASPVLNSVPNGAAMAELVASVVSVVLAGVATRVVAGALLYIREHDGGGRVRAARRALVTLEVDDAHVWLDAVGGVVAVVSVCARDAAAAHAT
eukprot:IDg18566t1